MTPSMKYQGCGLPYFKLNGRQVDEFRSSLLKELPSCILGEWTCVSLGQAHHSVIFKGIMTSAIWGLVLLRGGASDVNLRDSVSFHQSWSFLGRNSVSTRLDLFLRIHMSPLAFGNPLSCNGEGVLHRKAFDCGTLLSQSFSPKSRCIIDIFRLGPPPGCPIPRG